MYIKKLKIKNFKCFDNYEIEFNKRLNVLVGNNDVGKSTILEAIHLCLTGFFRGKYLKNNLIQDIFNNKCVREYLDKIKENKSTPLPSCLIELYFDDCDPILYGKENSDGSNECCISYSIEFDSKYSKEYEFYIESGEVFSLPVEYYTVNWRNSAGIDVTGRTTPTKSTIIDTSDTNLRNSSDTYVSKIVKDNLENSELLGISQLYRETRDNFVENEILKNINEKLSEETHILDTNIQLDIESLKVTDWEKSIITKVNSIPFEYVGKGIQSAVRIELSLNSKSAEASSILLIEEPENHLSFSKMSKLLNEIVDLNEEKQIFVTTHSSFVANKLNIENLLLLNREKYSKFTSLSEDTFNFFMKKPGYDTLRFLLCKKAILVEGDADELIVQRAYFDKYNKLPIEDEIDVISVGTSFLRFLEIATIIEKETIVLTDNDGDIEALEKKYESYIGDNEKDYIKILYDKSTHENQGTLKSKNGGSFNYDTLEPCLLRANDLLTLNRILNRNDNSDDNLLKYMANNKTECALKIFDSSEKISYPTYIEDAINE